MHEAIVDWVWSPSPQEDQDILKTLNMHGDNSSTAWH